MKYRIIVDETKANIDACECAKKHMGEDEKYYLIKRSKFFVEFFDDKENAWKIVNRNYSSCCLNGFESINDALIKIKELYVEHNFKINDGLKINPVIGEWEF